MVEQQFGDWQGSTLPPVEPAPAVVSKQPESLWVFDSDSQVCLQLAFRLPGRKDIRTLPLRLLRRLLSWGGGARLPLRLREQLGLTYAVDASCSMLDDAGYLLVDLSVAPENIQQTVAELLKVLDELRQQPVSQQELDAVIRTYLFDLDFSRDQTESMAVRYGWGTQVDYLRSLEQDCAELQQLTVEQVHQVAVDTFSAAAMKLVVIGPWTEDDKRAVDALLNQF